MLVEDPIILVADDDECAELLMTTAFERAGLVRPIQFVRDGVEAIAYLSGEGIYSDRAKSPLPTVLLLDLNMPRKDGFEVLSWIRRQPALRQLHVYVLSGSSQARDIHRAYELGATSYLVKPGNLEGLMLQNKALLAWLKLSHFSSLAEPMAGNTP